MRGAGLVRGCREFYEMAKTHFFWFDNWLGDVPLRRRFGRLFDLATNKLISVADMFELGWEEGARRGGGGEGCGHGKKRCWRRVDYYLMVFLCRLILLTGGSGIQTFMMATQCEVLTRF